MITAIVAAALLQVATAGGTPIVPTEDERGNVIDRFQSGLWRGTARNTSPPEWGDHRVTCSITADNATLTQVRAQESPQMRSAWTFRPPRQSDARPLLIEWIRVDSVRYEVTNLPWRLASANDEGIILTYDVQMLAFRRNASRQWLPLAYLTDELFEADEFEIAYRFDDGESRTEERRQAFSLDGFSQVAKWCGRQLLFDRQDQDEVRGLTR